MQQKVRWIRLCKKNQILHLKFKILNKINKYWNKILREKFKKYKIRNNSYNNLKINKKIKKLKKMWKKYQNIYQMVKKFNLKINFFRNNQKIYKKKINQFQNK